jgi:RNA polymerase sigma factor (sigma-70 family)
MPINKSDLKYFDSIAQWSALKEGKKSAFEHLYQLYSNALYNYGTKFTKDKDLVKESIQELFVQIWTKKENLGNPKDVKNYLFKSFRHLIFKKIAFVQKHIQVEEMEEYFFDATLNMEESIIYYENESAIKQELQGTISKLTSRQREAIFLKFYERLSYEEISIVMGISVKSTYKIMARSLGFLRENLSKSDFLLLLFLLNNKLYH